jgi:hypothetical protein
VETTAPGRARDPLDLAWASLSFLIPSIVSLLSKMSAIDLAYHLRAGEEILHGSIPRVDTYTFTVAGVPWLDQQWLAQAVLAFVHRFGGWPTLLATQSLLVGITFWLVYLAARAAGAKPRTGSLLTIAGFVVSSPALVLRPQLLAMPLVALLLLAAAGRDAHPGRLWLAPVLAALCANIHGSFVLFPLIAGLAWLDDRRRRRPEAGRTLLITGVTALATVLTPFGPRVWMYVYDVSTNPVIRTTITEWAPLTLATVPGWLTILSAFGVIAYLTRRREPTPWTALVTLAVFFLLALSAQRGIVWWGMVTPVVIGGLLATRPSEVQVETPTAGPRLPAYAIVGTLISALIALAPWWRGSTYDRFLTGAPPGLTQAVAANLTPGTRTLVNQPWGSWFEFAVPDVPVFVDSRIEIIPDDVWHDYGQVGFSGAEWEDVLDRWHVQAIVASTDWDLLPTLRADPGWRELYADDDGALFVRA